jgi:hypothetical protein
LYGAKNMNMISTGAFQIEMDASNKQPTLAEKFVAVWEKKNAKAVRAGGVSLMALSLAACGSDSKTTTTATTTTTTTTTPTVDAAANYALTTGIDMITGGSGNDNIAGGATSAATQTLNTLDTIDGGAGTDTLTAVIVANVTPGSQNIETLVVSATAAATLDLTGSTGITSVTNTGSSNTLTVSNIGADVALTLSSTGDGGTFNYAASTVTGTADAKSISVSGVTGGTLNMGTGVETLTLNSIGSANSLAGVTTGATTINITGDQNLTIAAAGELTQTTVDASAATGKITLQSDAATAATITTGSGADAITADGGSAITETISLGAGDDSLTFDANLANADVLNGGEGTDTLVGISANLVALTSTTTTSNVTNFEKISVSDALSGGIDISDVQEDGINTMSLIENGAGTTLVNGTETITAEAGTFTLNLGSSSAANVADINGTLIVVDSGTATTDSLVINNTTVNTTANRRLDVFDGEALTSTGYENVTFNTGTVVGANVEQAFSTITITPDALASNVTFTATGGNGLDIVTSIATTSTGVLTVDASGMTAQAAGTTTFDVALVSLAVGGTITATGSAGDDIFGTSAADLGNFASTIEGGAGNDAIFTGSGIDTVTGGAGNDTIDVQGGVGDSADGGAGNDTIVIAADANLTATDTYIGGDGTDALYLGADMTDAAATLSAFSGFETLRINAGAAEAITMSNFINNQGFTKIEFGAHGAGGATAAVTNVAAAVTTIQFGTTNQDGTAVVANDDVTIDRLVDTATNSLTVLHNSGGAAATIDAFIADDEETITIHTNAAADDLTISAMDSADLTTLTLTGAGDITITGFTAAGDAPTTVDASAMTGAAAVTVTASAVATTMTAGSGGATFVGGSGADTITGSTGVDVLTGGAGNDTINGGEGADTTINGGIGGDTLTGGAGDDNFVMALSQGVLATSVIDASTGNAMASTASLAAGDVITFGNGVDVITDLTVGAGGVDDVNVNTSGATASALGLGRDDLDNKVGTADDILHLSGTYEASTGKFTLSADGIGGDTMIIDVDTSTAVSRDITTNSTMFILQGIDSDNMVAGDLI